MTNCLGCQRCEDGQTVLLVSGQNVCTWCPAWRLECEARYLLAMPLQERRDMLARIEKRRDVSELKQVMTMVHGAKNV